jgi:cell pole-organizing protein PopZ
MGEMTRGEPATKSEAAEIAAAAPEKAQPPRLPSLSASSSEPETVEDAAAQLLRPILKQWLSENMPKIVEKALKSESGDGGPPIRPRI